MEYKIKFAFEHKLKKVSSFLLFTVLILIYLLETTPLYAQTTWTGNTNSDWNTAANWTAGVPDTGDVVIIPNVINDPIITNTTAKTKSILIMTAGSLTVSSFASLTCKRAIDTAMVNYGTLINHGLINLDSIVFDFNVAVSSLINFGVIVNDGYIYISTKTLTNAGEIRTIINHGTITNDGKLEIEAFPNYWGIWRSIENFGVITNNDSIFIHTTNTNTAGVNGSSGIHNKAVFNNNIDGVIVLDGKISFFIANELGSFTNEGDIKIKGDTLTNSFGILNEAVFLNNASGVITIDSMYSYSFFNECSVYYYNFNTSPQSKFTNAGSLLISNYNLSGFVNEGIFKNTATGTINLESITNGNGYGFFNTFGTPSSAQNFQTGNATNDGIIIVGSIHGGAAGLINYAKFTNNHSGVINIDRVSAAGIFISYDTLNNFGAINIGNQISGGALGIFLQFGGVNGSFPGTLNNLAGGIININRTTENAISIYGSSLNNSSIINLGSIASIGTHGIKATNAFFNNNVGGIININRSNTAGISIGGDFVNAGSINIGSIADVGSYGVENLGSFTNTNGSNLKIDRCTFMGAYNTSGSTFTNGGNITMGSIATLGAYGLQNNGTFHHNAGAILNIDRSTSTGLYPAQGIFHNHGIITIGSIASVGAYGVFAGGTFNNNSGSLLNIDRSTSVGLYTSNGTFNNAGNINLGAIASTGTYGIYNGGIFNHTNGSINIDRAIDFGLSNVGGMFNNSAALTIGAIISTSQYGLQNSAIFNNNIGGMIKVDRSSLHGIRNIGSGDFTNVGNINVGSIANVGLVGMVNTALFKNNLGSTININRSTDYGLWNYGGGDFTNNATITIGAQAISGISILNQSLFTNNAGSFLGLH
jgi:hypothetical protein